MWRTTLGAVALLVAAGAAQAGQACTETAVTADGMERAVRLATQVQSQLDASGARAAILARVGSDVSQYGLRWTHAGLVTRDAPDEPWTLLHKLNHCGKSDASLYRQGLGNFFLDNPREYRALVLIPSPRLQEALVDQARRDEGRTVDEPSYSLIAYPFGLEYQNSNGWLLEFIAEADSGGIAIGRKAAQKRLRRTGYVPDTIGVGAFQRVGASLFRANVAFLDHPLSERLSGEYSIVSVESIVRYLGELRQVAEVEEVALPP